MSDPRKHHRLIWMLIGTLLVGHAVLAVDCARYATVTHDEYWHLPVGLLSWKTGRFDFDNLNPTLIRMYAAVPLLFTSAVAGPADVGLDASGHGDAFLAANRDRYQELFTYGRTAIVVLSVLTGLLLALWSFELFGPAAACLTALIWSFSPTVLANASLVTTDLGAACLFVAALYSLWKYAQQPSWKRAVLLGICLGLAQLAKFTSLLLLPLCGVLWFVHRVGNAEAEKRPAKTLVLQWMSVLLLCTVVLNAGYLFRGTASPLESYRFRSRMLSEISDSLRWLSGVPLPLPRDYVEGLDHQRQIMESQHPVFLDGQWSTEGFPHYYLMTLLYKLPHSLQLLTLLAGALVAWPGREPRLLRTQVFLTLPFVALLTIASCSGMQLGLRYILPVLPFLFLFAGQAARWMNWKRRRLPTAVLAVLIVLTPLAVRYHPHHLAFFNLLAGGPVGGRAHLLDSNLDWGQDLRGLKQFLDANNLDEIGLAYFGTMPADALGIVFHLPPSRAPQPGWYAVSVNFVQGRPHVVRDERGKPHPVGLDEFGYFRFFEPVARIGYSIDVYSITELDVLRWRAAVSRQMQRN